jgi:hypothetical protein
MPKLRSGAGNSGFVFVDACIDSASIRVGSLFAFRFIDRWRPFKLRIVNAIRTVSAAIRILASRIPTNGRIFGGRVIGGQHYISQPFLDVVVFV